MSELAKRTGMRCAVWAAVGVLAIGLAATARPAAAASLRLAQAATPAPEAAPPSDVKPPSAPLGTPATVIDGKSAESLLGKKVQSEKGDDLGRIVDVIVDKAGQIRAAVVDFGGFLGVGSRKIAIDWHLVHMSGDGKLDHLVVDMPPDQLRAAPAYKEGEPVVVLGPGAEQGKPAAASPPAAAVPAPATPDAAPPKN